MPTKNKNRNYNKNISVIVPAAGSGKRMGKNSTPKAFIRLNGKPLITHILDKFTRLPAVREIIIAVNQNYWRNAKRLVSGYKINQSANRSLPEIKLIQGGKERCDSVFNALKVTDPGSRLILIHDAARPLVKKEDIIRLIKTVRKSGAAILAAPVVDTIKRVNQKGCIKETLPRHELWSAQTPQGFKRNILIKAYNKSLKERKIITDDSYLVEKLGYPVKVVLGSYENIKITTPYDKIFAQDLPKNY